MDGEVEGGNIVGIRMAWLEAVMQAVLVVEC